MHMLLCCVLNHQVQNSDSALTYFALIVLAILKESRFSDADSICQCCCTWYDDDELISLMLELYILVITKIHRGWTV